MILNNSPCSRFASNNSSLLSDEHEHIRRRQAKTIRTPEKGIKIQMLLGAPMNRSYPAIPPYLGSALPSLVPSQTITEPTLWSSSLQIHILFLLQLILIRSSIHHLHSLWGQRSMYANRHKSGLFRNICKLVISPLPFQSSPDHNFHKRPRRFLRCKSCF